MRITLTVIEGPHQGQEYSFARHDTFLVGRSKHAHFRLPTKDKFFSRIHFMVEVNPPQCRLIDMGSHNGTFVNGAKVLTADLKDGDEIRAGHTTLKLVFHSEYDDAVAQPSTTAAITGANEPSGFRIQRELGRGGMGIVYLATRKNDDKPIALKIVAPAVTPTPQQIDSFLRQARTLTALTHPNIVRLHEVGESDDFLFFVSDYVPGTDAAALLKKGGPFEISRVLKLAGQMLDALDCAHRKGFVHRDIKPSNFLIAETDGTEQLKLTDFGLARVYEASPLAGVTMTSDLGGSVAFLAPERITNYHDDSPAADQYSAAATLYTLLTGAHVFDFPSETHRRFSVILRQTAVRIHERRPDIPDSVATVLHKALSRNPTNRYPDVASFRNALMEFQK
ncbi:MAG: protein kinase [Planctomycetes bacterium]|nr:protein kinase [Planctomycetota bacterium]